MSEILTLEAAIAAHRELWDWLARNPSKGKPDWPGWKNPKYLKFGDIFNHCFFCKYAASGVLEVERTPICSRCPAAVANPRGIYCLDGLFDKWRFESTSNPDKRVQAAIAIRDVPIKPELLATLEPAPKFKVGDKVVINGLPNQGRVGKVHDLPSDNTVGVIFPQKSRIVSPRFDEKFPPEAGYGYYYRVSRLTPFSEWLTKEKTVELHRSLWEWLAQNPGKAKFDWPGWKDFPHITAWCFFCEHAILHSEDGAKPCTNCPAAFTENKYDPGSVAFCLGGLFLEWTEAHFLDTEKRARLAVQIRDIPIKMEGTHRVTMPMDDEYTSYKFSGNRIVCTIWVDGKKYKGVARRGPDDIWDEAEGKKYALARAKEKAEKDKFIEINEMCRIPVSSEHARLVMEYGRMQGAGAHLPKEEYFALLKAWCDGARKAFNSTRALYFNNRTMTFILFDVEANKVTFENRKVFTRPDGTMYLKIPR